ncbi:MAG: ankyrin repeat domain-containing protein [Burkholderiales bacterium]
MNQRMALICMGWEHKYPHELERCFPRIVDKLCNLWERYEIEAYFNDLLVNKERAERQGFPPKVIEELFGLYSLWSNEKNPEPEDSDPWSNVKIKRKLEELGIEFDLQGFIKSVESGNKAAVMAFLDAGVDIDVAGERGWTPLMVSLFHRRENVAMLLLEQGADIHAQDDEGYAPLHWAAYAGHKKVIEKMVAKGAHVNASNKYGWTPLLQAATLGHKAVVELLLGNGANVNAADHDGWTALHKAAGNGHADIVVLLIAKGAHVNAAYKDGTTPLLLALKNDHFAVVEQLILAGAGMFNLA